MAGSLAGGRLFKSCHIGQHFYQGQVMKLRPVQVGDLWFELMVIGHRRIEDFDLGKGRLPGEPAQESTALLVVCV